jgi:Leucine-rich repeat (LRR) protein
VINKKKKKKLTKNYSLIFKKWFTILKTLNHFLTLSSFPNQIHGVFPSLVTHIPTLIMVNLSDNLFSGVIPGEIGNLSRLEELNVANNSFSGAIPIEIKQCSSLRHLHFEGSHFVGTIPDFLGDMRGL